jgi:hypothetical protein
MARTRWPVGPVNPGLLPGQADQTGSAGGCLKTWGPADKSISRQPERRRPIRRSGRDPGPRRYARTSPKPRKQGRKQESRARSTIHILPADSARVGCWLVLVSTGECNRQVRDLIISGRRSPDLHKQRSATRGKWYGRSECPVSPVVGSRSIALTGCDQGLVVVRAARFTSSVRPQPC